ncbi:MAG: hypothetical protein SOZ52_02350 [Pyramidobacter sp.]|nr:hypothetical protein [Pyramidobacter sp.]
MLKFLHIGVPTKTPKPGEVYAEGMKVHLTDPEDWRYKYEYLRFDDDSWMAEEIKTRVHVAFLVDELESHLKEADKVLLPPTPVSDTATIAFILKGEMVLELMVDSAAKAE